MAAIRRSLVLACAILVGSRIGDAFGAPAAQDPQAIFEAAIKSFDKGAYALALPDFERAAETSGSPNARLYVARCLVGLGRVSEAYEVLQRTVDDATERALKEPRFAQTRDAATGELAALEAKIARVVLHLEEEVAGLELSVANAAVSAAKLEHPLGAPPGVVVVRAKAPGRVPFTREITLGSGGVVEVRIELPREPPHVAATPVVVTPPPAGVGGLRKASFGVIGLGVAGGALFTVAGLRARSTFSSVQSECGGARCVDPKYVNVVENGRRETLLANVGLVTGIVGIVGGALMFAAGGRKSSPSDTPALVVSASGEGGSIAVRRSF